MDMVFSLKATPKRVGLACLTARRFFRPSAHACAQSAQEAELPPLSDNAAECGSARVFSKLHPVFAFMIKRR